MRGIRDGVTDYVQKYTEISQRLFPELGKHSCAPTRDCFLQMGTAVWDTISAAGGLSVPSTIGTGLAVLFSTAKNNPFPSGSYQKGQALNFYWEHVRYFAPVVGFPHWQKRPTCEGQTKQQTQRLQQPNGKYKACPKGQDSWWTGYPPINQYQGGIRVVPALALAQRDPRKWGEDANTFKIRSTSTYIKNSVGFAEMAEDPTVQGGKNDRSCPGKDLGLMIGEAFFKHFDASQWEVDGNPEDILFKSGPAYHDAFTLVKKAKEE